MLFSDLPDVNTQLKEKLEYANRVHLYADNDSGIKLALGAVFCDWIAHHKLYAPFKSLLTSLVALNT